MSKSCSLCSNKSTMIWVAIIIIVVACVGALIWSNRETISEDLGSIAGIPVQKSEFSWDAQKKNIDQILDKAGFGRNLKSVDRNDIGGDGVPEIIYETKNKGEFVMLTENPANTPSLLMAYEKFADKEGTPFVFYKQEANEQGITKSYVIDKPNFIIANTEKSADGTCVVKPYRWEQVKRAMVLYTITKEQEKKYCAGAQ